MSLLRRRHETDRLAQLRALMPRDPWQLQRFVDRLLGLHVNDQPIMPGSASPLSYLVHSFFGDVWRGVGPMHQVDGGDALLWANRGGGKTMLGAAATLLDLIFKPGVQVRVLAGSLEQGRKMHEHLCTLLGRASMRGVLASPPTRRRVRLRHGSQVEILAGSARSVRGVRVHKLRCDELEDLPPDLWDAAQLVTRSGACGPWLVRGSIEAMSTHHRLGGLMGRLLDARSAPGGGHCSGEGGRRLFRWTAMDVIERCPPRRACEPCLLWCDCRGRAKQASGFVTVEDLIRQRRRTSDATWRAEMLCERQAQPSAA